MRIGIYMAYAPYVKEFTLKKEGLGRYLSFLLKAFENNKDEVVIACPRWCIHAVDELLEEHNISRERLEFVVPKSDPAIYRTYMFLKSIWKREKTKRTGRMKEAAYKLFGRIVDSIFSTFSMLKIVLIALVFVMLGVLLSPVLLVCLFSFLLYMAGRKILFLFTGKSSGNTAKNNIKMMIKDNKLLRLIYDMLYHASLNKREQENAGSAGAINVGIQVKHFRIMKGLQERIRYASAADIVRKANYMKNKPDVWYCHTAFWTEFCDIEGTKVVCVPDLVPVEFPFPFSKGEFTDATETIKRTIEKARYFITYSEYLKKSLLMERFGKKEEDVITIRHAQNNMLPYIDLEDYFAGKKYQGSANEYFVKNVILKGVINRMIGEEQYISDGIPANVVSLKDMRYIFYPSQIRGNKNVLTLIKAYEYLLREENIPIKLFLTGNYEQDEELNDYIRKRRLQYDVLSFVNVSNQELAALYYGAELVVNPTFYEGGFPFTFGEGMSVGTPSVMSGIPQVMEELQSFKREQYEKWLFDPCSYKEMAEKIKYGLENRETMYNTQKEIYDCLNKRTWDEVGYEYAEAFHVFIAKTSEQSA